MRLRGMPCKGATGTSAGREPAYPTGAARPSSNFSSHAVLSHSGGDRLAQDGPRSASLTLHGGERAVPVFPSCLRETTVPRCLVAGAGLSSRGVLAALPEPPRGFADPPPASSAASSSARHLGAVPVPSGGGTARHGNSVEAFTSSHPLSQGASAGDSLTERGSGGSQGWLVLYADAMVDTVEFALKKVLDRRQAFIDAAATTSNAAGKATKAA